MGAPTPLGAHFSPFPTPTKDFPGTSGTWLWGQPGFQPSLTAGQRSSSGKRRGGHGGRQQQGEEVGWGAAGDGQQARIRRGRTSVLVQGAGHDPRVLLLARGLQAAGTCGQGRAGRLRTQGARVLANGQEKEL